MITETRNEILLENEPIEDVNSFLYLGANISNQGGTDEDICDRIAKARKCFRSLGKVWKSGNLELRVKLNLYKSLVMSILLYGSETWRLTVAQTRKLNTFQNKCLKIIMKIFWPLKISNEELLLKAKCNSIDEDIRLRRWTFTGHVLRSNPGEIPSVALTWAPEGRRRRGRPRLTWRRMMDAERNEAGWSSWGEARVAAGDRRGWKSKLKALYASGHKR